MSLQTCFTYIYSETRTLSHTTLSHTTFPCHAQPFHKQLFHTQLLSHNLFSTIFIHFPPSPIFFPPFPSHFLTCFELVGRNSHVGLSSPLFLLGLIFTFCHILSISSTLHNYKPLLTEASAVLARVRAQ